MAVFCFLTKRRAMDVLLFYFFIIFFLSLTVLGLCCCMDFSVAVECWGYPPVAVHELLSVMASLAAQPRL